MQVDIEQYISALRAGIGAVPPVLMGHRLAGGTHRRMAPLPIRGATPHHADAGHGSLGDVGLSQLPVGQRSAPCRAAIAATPHPTRKHSRSSIRDPTGPIPLTPVGAGLDLGGSPTSQPRPISRIERAEEVWVEEEEWHGEVVQREAAALPEVAAMTEVGQASNGRWSARPPDRSPSAPAARPSRDPLWHDRDAPSSRATYRILTTRPRRDRRPR